MLVNRIPRLLPAIIAAIVAVVTMPVVGNAAVAVDKAQHHHDAKQLTGDKLKQDGHHDIDRNGKFTSSVEAKGGKITAFHVKQSEKGNIPVKKYKTHKKMAQTVRGHLMNASARLAQMQDLGEEYIGYSYIDDGGNEEIYWFPVEMIFDGDTGATDYVPQSS
jgi:hypothetical protein